ncbi:hypothetical protein DFJ77DRAFT_506126 [Powellomyces hirtus]|nr:hypothetical protein DFJ77DRAFT_506126 [Powellomyces hirtus]
MGPSSVVQKAPFADNPTHGLVPLSATEIFLVRLGGWATLVRRLMMQFEMIVEHHKRVAEAYGKCAREFAVPITSKEGNPVFGRDESCQYLFQNIQSSHIKASQENTEAASMLEMHVLPNLRSLLADLRRKAGDSDKEWVSLDRELARDRDMYVKYEAQLKLALAKHNGEVPDGADKDSTAASRDPWAANIALKKHIATCVHKQDHYRAVLLAQQEHFATFESTIVQTLRVVLSTFFDWQKKDLDASHDVFKKLKATLHTLDVARDWDSFRKRHMDRIIEKDTRTLNEGDIIYDGRENALVASDKEGILYRRESGMKFGFRKAWKDTLVVVTSANYLHALPPSFSQTAFSTSSSSLPDQQEDANSSKIGPELSLYLPDCVIGPLMMNEKEPEEFIIQQKAGGMFGGEKKHKFKGANMDQSAMWWAYLNERVRMAKPQPQPTANTFAAKPATPSAAPSRQSTSSVGQTVDPLVGAVVDPPRSNPLHKPIRHNPDPLGASVAVKAATATSIHSKPLTPSRSSPAPQAVKVVPSSSSPIPSSAPVSLIIKGAPPNKPQYHDPDGEDFEIGQNLDDKDSEEEDNQPLHVHLGKPSAAPTFITSDPSLSLAQQMEAALSKSATDAEPGPAGDAFGYTSPHEHTTSEMWSSPVADFSWEAPAKGVVTIPHLGELDEDEMGGGAWA